MGTSPNKVGKKNGEVGPEDVGRLVPLPLEWCSARILENVLATLLQATQKLLKLDVALDLGGQVGTGLPDRYKAF